MQVLLLSVSAHITKQLGMAPGGEFRAAYREVQQQQQQLFYSTLKTTTRKYTCTLTATRRLAGFQ